MGGVCSSMERICPRRSAVDKSPSEGSFRSSNRFHDSGLLADQIRWEFDKMNYSTPTPAAKDNLTPPRMIEIMEKKRRDENSLLPGKTDPPPKNTLDDGPPLRRTVSHRSSSTKSKLDVDAKTGMTKVSGRSSLLDKAGNIGLGKAVEVIDKLASKITDLNTNNGFNPVVTTKGEISMLAFEVANTIVRGSNLVHSLSKENITHLKEVILQSEGVQLLISNNMDELLRIAAADKREELNIISREVIRFGNSCKDPQWHNLDRFFERLDSELTPQIQLKEEAEAIMQQLITMVQDTAELYNEWHALDKFEQDYQQTHQEENASQGDNSLYILRQELKSQRRQVKSLKKKSLWSKTFEEVVEKLVDIVHFLKLEIREAFGNAGGVKPVEEPAYSNQRLGAAGLALHHANVISQINTLMFRASRVPKSSRDMLYQSLPPNTKSELRSRLQSFHVNEELSVLEIKAEMGKILGWLVPVANNTTKIHHGFGWVGEWAKTGSEIHRNPAGQTDLTRIETLHHASKERTESYILELVLWLHHLVSHTTADNGGSRSPIKSPIRSPTQRTAILLGNKPNKSPELTKEDHEMLRDVIFTRLTPGISKSQELGRAKIRSNKDNRLSKSSSHSSTSWNKEELFQTRRASTLPEISFDNDWNKALDVIDRVDSLEDSVSW